MRILHTSDWHLGAAFHERNRGPDEAHALAQIVALARTHAVDAVLIAGDVFDTANPGAAEQRLWYRTLVDLVQVGGVGSVVAIAGNHDGGLRLDGPKELLAALHVQVRGQFLRHDAVESVLMPLRDRSGSERAWCAAVPYLREGDVVLGEDHPERAQRLADAVHRRWAAVRAAVPPGRPWVAMTHAFAAGGRAGGLEHPVLAEVGNLGRSDLAALATGAAYAALGHLHRPQAIAGHDHWRYCGSLLPTGFDEVDSDRSVVLADLPDDGRAASVSVVALTPYRSYRRLSGGPEQVLTAIAELARPADDAPTPWLQVDVMLDRPYPGIHRQAADAARAHGWDLLSCQARRGGAEAGDAAGLALAELRSLDPLAVFRLLHRQQYAADPPAELERSFSVLLDAVHAADRGG